MRRKHPSFLCLPKEKKAKERAPCYRLIIALLADHGAKRTRRYAPQTPFRIIRDRLRCSLAIEGNPGGAFEDNRIGQAQQMRLTRNRAAQGKPETRDRLSERNEFTVSPV